MKTTQRVWRDTLGRLVPETDPGAAFLAYAIGDDIPDESVPAWLRPDQTETPVEETKAEEPAANKAAPKSANKAKG